MRLNLTGILSLSLLILSRPGFIEAFGTGGALEDAVCYFKTAKRIVKFISCRPPERLMGIKMLRILSPSGTQKSFFWGYAST